MDKLLKIATIGAAIIGAIAVYKLMQLFGVIQTKEEQETEEADKKLDTLDFLSYPTKWLKQFNDKNKGKSFKLLKLSQQNEACKTIYDAKGSFLYDDEFKALDKLKKLRSKFEIAQVSEKFYSLYGKDLLNYLKSFIEDDQYKYLVQILTEKPDVAR
jgi:hypothetical protein